MLLTDLSPETIVDIAARLPVFRANHSIKGKRLCACHLLNFSLANQRINWVLSINNKQLKNEIADVQYPAAHSLRFKSRDVTIDDLREYDVTKWSVRYFIEGLAEYFEDARLEKERKDILKIFAAGLYVLEALHHLRIPSKDALPARLLVEAITPEIWALARFASIGLVQILRHNNASLIWKHPAWSSSATSTNTELAIEELILDRGLGVMHIMMSTDTFGIPSVTKVMHETTRRFVLAVRNIPPYDIYSRQIIDPMPMPEFGFLQGLCKVRPPFSVFATSILMTQYMTRLSALLPDGKLDCIMCLKKWKANVKKSEVKSLMKQIPRDTEWRKFYDVNWVRVVNTAVLSDRCGYWKGPQTIVSLTRQAGEVLRDRKTMVDEWYVDLKKITLPVNAPTTKEGMIMSLNTTIEECGDPGNPMAGLEHPL